jgi:hypothetical protein
MAEWSPSEKRRRERVEAGGTVVANLKTDARLIAWARKERRLVRICRPTIWGNPFVIGKHGDRQTVLEKYRRYLGREQKLVGRVKALKGKVLACWCHPEDCHGDELVRLVEMAA